MHFNLHLIIDQFEGMNARLVENKDNIQLSLNSVSLFQENDFKPQKSSLIICTLKEYLEQLAHLVDYSFIIIGPLSAEKFNHKCRQAIILEENFSKEFIYINVLEWLQGFNLNNESIRQILYESKSINALTENNYYPISNSIALFDASYQMVEMIDVGTDVSKSQVWRSVLENGSIDLSIYSYNEMQIINKAIQNRDAFVVFEKDDLEHILFPIYYKGKFIGNMSSVSFTGGYDSKEISWLLHFSNLVNTSLLLQTRAQSSVEIAPNVLIQLINSQDYRQRHLDFFLSQHPWLKDEYFQLYVCDLTSQLILTGEIFRKYISTLQLEFNKAVIFYYENQIIILKPNKQNAVKEEKIFENLDLKVGLSSPINDITLINIAYKQAKTVLQQSEERISVFNNLAFPILLDHIHSSELCDIFVYQPFLYLWKNGNSNERDFLNSIYVFLTNERSLPKTSNLLNLHRNSLKYRLEKISEEIQVDLLSETLCQSTILLMIITLHRLINNDKNLKE